MIEIEMSKDIRGYEPKVLASMSIRQLVGVCVGILCAAPIVLYLPVDMTIRIIIAVLVAMPGFACGFLKMYDMPCEVFLLKVFLPYYINSKSKKYIVESDYDELVQPFTGTTVKNRSAYKKEYRPRK